MTLKRAKAGRGFVFSDVWSRPISGEKSKKSARDGAKIAQHHDWPFPAKRAKACCCVNEHQREVDS